jgi:hypothetical protein
VKAQSGNRRYWKPSAHVSNGMGKGPGLITRSAESQLHSMDPQKLQHQKGKNDNQDDS